MKKSKNIMLFNTHDEYLNYRYGTVSSNTRYSFDGQIVTYRATYDGQSIDLVGGIPQEGLFMYSDNLNERNIASETRFEPNVSYSGVKLYDMDEEMSVLTENATVETISVRDIHFDYFDLIYGYSVEGFYLYGSLIGEDYEVYVFFDRRVGEEGTYEGISCIAGDSGFVQGTLVVTKNNTVDYEFKGDDLVAVVDLGDDGVFNLRHLSEGDDEVDGERYYFYADLNEEAYFFTKTLYMTAGTYTNQTLYEFEGYTVAYDNITVTVEDKGQKTITLSNLILTQIAERGCMYVCEDTTADRGYGRVMTSEPLVGNGRQNGISVLYQKTLGDELQFAADNASVNVTTNEMEGFKMPHVSLCRDVVPSDGRRYCVQYNNNRTPTFKIYASNSTDTEELYNGEEVIGLFATEIIPERDPFVVELNQWFSIGNGDGFYLKFEGTVTGTTSDGETVTVPNTPLFSRNDEKYDYNEYVEYRGDEETGRKEYRIIKNPHSIDDSFYFVLFD